MLSLVEYVHFGKKKNEATNMRWLKLSFNLFAKKGRERKKSAGNIRNQN